MFKKYCLMVAVAILSTSIGLQTWAASEEQRVICDSDIATAVENKIMEHKMLVDSGITVKNKKGIIFLKGDLNSNSEAETAIELASSVPGVVDVDTSSLFIRGSRQPLTDSVITAKIKGTYLRENIFSNKSTPVVGVHVETNDGVVYLTGQLNNQSEIENSEKLAKAVKGVKEVKSNLVLKKK